MRPFLVCAECRFAWGILLLSVSLRCGVYENANGTMGDVPWRHALVGPFRATSAIDAGILGRECYGDARAMRRFLLSWVICDVLRCAAIVLANGRSATDMAATKWRRGK